MNTTYLRKTSAKFYSVALWSFVHTALSFAGLQKHPEMCLVSM
jgi:hypothetical protein